MRYQLLVILMFGCVTSCAQEQPPAKDIHPRVEQSPSTTANNVASEAAGVPVPGKPEYLPSTTEGKELKQAMTCHYVSRLRETFAEKLADPSSWIESSKHSGLTESQIKDVEDALTVIEENSTKCTSAKAPTAVNLMALALRASQTGDLHAGSCYVSAPWFDAEPTARRLQGVEQYREESAAIISRNLSMGDWEIVSVLIQAHSLGSSGMFATLMPQDPVMLYRYVKLQSLGSALFDESERNRISRQVQAAGSVISDSDRRAQDVWATNTYERIFRKTPRPYVHQSLCN